ncbi:MAG: choice-of-anchor tandem repeat GloVer-containing protein [Candidatus Acidiferrum sp.]
MKLEAGEKKMAVISEANWKATRLQVAGGLGIAFAGASRLVIAATAVLLVSVLPLQAQTEQVLYAFTGAVTNGPDGANPGAPLLRDKNGNLYGTTEAGGESGDGTVFELVYISPGKYQEQVLYSFKGITTTEPSTQDGADPMAGLIMDASGNLYGTTAIGGVAVGCTNLGGCGTVFELHSPASPGQGYLPEILHNFGGNLNLDGYQPDAGLVMDSSGNLYGTTLLGGSSGFGTVFEISSSGTYSLLHTFAAGSNDGGLPYAGLVMDGAGNLFGTASLGGVSNQGTVFELANSSGNYTYNTLYSFKLNGDGQAPIAGVIADSSGNIFGTTQFGGTSKACGTKLGCGTVFELVYSPPSPPATSANYTEMLLHTFTGLTDGDGGTPLGLVVDSKGNLFGATEVGGGSSNTCVYGCGTVFELVYSPSSPPSTSGSYTENVLYSFPTFSADGLIPNAALIVDSSDNLYGVTTNGGYSTPSGGACPSGCGTVFEYTPSRGAFAQYSTIGPINFGAVQVNTTGSQQLTLTNSGGSSFMLNGITLQGTSSAFSITSVVCNGSAVSAPYTSISVTLAVGQTCTVTLQFLPTVNENGYAEDLVLATTATSSNASAGPGGTGQALLLVGDGVEPYANFTNSTSGSPTQVTFGNVVENTTATQTVTVSNTGDGPLVIQTARVAPGQGFSYSQVVCNSVTEPVPLPSPFTISAGTSCIFTVQFDPITLGPLGGALGLLDNAAAGESNLTNTSSNGTSFQQDVALSGTGVTSIATTATTTTINSTSSSYMGLALPAGYALVGTPVTVNFSVQPVSGTLIPTGTVIVEDGFHEYCNPVGTLTSANKGLGSCQLTFIGLGNGSTPLSAQYTPDTASSSAGLLGSATVQPLFTENLVQIVNCGTPPSVQSAAQGTIATYTFTVCLAGDVNAAVTALVSSGCPQGATCDATVTAVQGQTGVYKVVVTITVGSGGTVPPQDFRPFSGPAPLMFFALGLLVAVLLGFHFAPRKRARLQLAYSAGLAIALALMVGNLTGCGSSGTSTTGISGTPPGMYTINVKISAGAFSANVPLTLTVTK